MTAFETWIAMGGYGQFVWPAYGLTALFLVAFVVRSFRGLRAQQKKLQRMREQNPAAADRKASPRPQGNSPHPLSAV